MRKVLNVLQSTWMAFKHVNEDNVYSCVGHPTPSDIKSIVNWLMAIDSFQECYESMFDFVDFGISGRFPIVPENLPLRFFF